MNRDLLDTFSGLIPLFVCGAIVLAAASCASMQSHRCSDRVADDPGQAYMRAVATAREYENDADKAAEAYDAFLVCFPRDPLASDALLNKGILYHNQADRLFAEGALHPDSDCVCKAVKAYTVFLRRFPDHPQTPNVLMKKGLIYANSGNTRKAIRACETFLRRFPNDPQAANLRAKRDALRHPAR